MSFSEFTKNENKSIIWGLLHEGGVFRDLPNTQVENVKKQFENTIQSMKSEFDLFFDQNDEGDDDYEQKAAEMITNSNKAVIRKMVEQIGLLKPKRPIDIRQAPEQRTAPVNLPVPPRFGGGGGGANGIPTKKPKIEEIYRADDLQKNRMSELEIRLKEKQSEMDNMLNNKIPDHIDFTDKSVTDDKLSSNEMERLLAEALSSRERELDKLIPSPIDKSKKLESIASSVRGAVPKRPQESMKKNVSFNETENEEIVYSKDVNMGAEVNGGMNESLDTNVVGEDENGNGGGLSFLSKLKKSSGDAPSSSSHTRHSYKPIPLDDIMAAEAMEDDEYEGNEGNNRNLEMRIYERRKTDETASAGESHKLNEKINIIQNEIQDIKRIQDRILNLLESKYNP
jgi:hypothetical protein